MPKKLFILVFPELVLMLACTISIVETPPPPSGTNPTQVRAISTTAANTESDGTATFSSQPPNQPGGTLPPGSTGIISGSPSGPYGVILVQPNDILNQRAGPGTGFGVISKIKPDFNGVMRTGPSSQVGDDLWVEVRNPIGAIGWVNSRFLTEYVSPDAFCNDTSVVDLLADLKTALNTSNGDALADLVSPIHGLDLRFWRYGTVANYDQTEASFVFGSDFEVNWGPAPGSGQDTKGTFREIPLPKLQEVLSAEYERHCNDTLDLATFSIQPWPGEYTNINFYNLYKPGSPGVELDWRAWLAGIEYFQGQPYLFALIHFQWEP